MEKVGKIINSGHFRGLDFLLWPVLVFGHNLIISAPKIK